MLRRLVFRDLAALTARVTRIERRVAEYERRVAELELRLRREARRPPIVLLGNTPRRQSGAAI